MWIWGLKGLRTTKSRRDRADYMYNRLQKGRLELCRVGKMRAEYELLDWSRVGYSCVE